MAESGEQVLQQRTALHYDSYPFEFLTPEDEVSIANMQPPPFRRFILNRASAGMKVGEIGCGPGRGTMFLVRNELKVVAIDLSHKSLELARGRAPEARFIQASNLQLPFAAATFDLVVSDGVIHHTPNAHRAFVENVRILQPGGYLYLGVYNRRGYYYFIYTYAGPLIRWMDRFWLGRIIVYALVFPLYYVTHLVKSAGKRTLRGARNFFYDYIMTPMASFHTREEIEAWGNEAGLDLLEYDPSLGNVHVFVFQKSAT